MKQTRDAKFCVDGYNYDSVTGWIFKDGKRRDYGNNAPYRKVSEKKMVVMAHRLAWRLHYGAWPTLQIDHWNRNKQDNRIENLRPATHGQNVANTPATKRSKSGERGVFWRPESNQWMVRVRSFNEGIQAAASHKISAILAARLIRRELHGEFAA